MKIQRVEVKCSFYSQLSVLIEEVEDKLVRTRDNMDNNPSNFLNSQIVALEALLGELDQIICPEIEPSELCFTTENRK